MPYSFYSKIVLPIKRNLQDTPYDCGPASVLAILQTLGIDVDEQKLMSLGHCSRENGTSPDGLKKIFNHFKINFEEIFKADLNTIEESIRSLKLCLVAYQAWPIGSEKETLDSGHYSVIFGISPHHLWIADPAKHHTHKYAKWGARKMRKDLFLKDWIDKEDNKQILERWMITVPLYQKLA